MILASPLDSVVTIIRIAYNLGNSSLAIHLYNRSNKKDFVALSNKASLINPSHSNPQISFIELFDLWEGTHQFAHDTNYRCFFVFPYVNLNCVQILPLENRVRLQILDDGLITNRTLANGLYTEDKLGNIAVDGLEINMNALVF